VRTNRITDKLEKIEDWRQRAHGAEYSSSRLAALLKVEERTLRRFFLKKFGRPTREQLEIFRQLQVEPLAKTGLSEKEISFKLHFKKASHFCRRFKKFHGVTFRVWLKSLTALAGINHLGFCFCP
jgi:AraC-like DNA-binding protein